MPRSIDGIKEEGGFSAFFLFKAGISYIITNSVR